MVKKVRGGDEKSIHINRCRKVDNFSILPRSIVCIQSIGWYEVEVMIAGRVGRIFHNLNYFIMEIRNQRKIIVLGKKIKALKL